MDTWHLQYILNTPPRVFLMIIHMCKNTGFQNVLPELIMQGAF